jgi:hypothetical protein
MTMSKDKQNNGEKEIKCDSNSLCYKTIEEFVEGTERRICESYKAASDAFLAEANIDTGDCVISKESAIVEEARLCR